MAPASSRGALSRRLPTLAAACLLALAVVAAPCPCGGPRAAEDAVRLDDFTHTYPPNKTYGSWEVHKIAPLVFGGDVQFFQFVDDGTPDGHYVHLRSGRDDSFSLGRRDGFRVQDWPVLEWEWKVTRTPSGGDVRVEARDDQAGSMCVIVNPGLMGFSSLCYLWENAGPKDTPIVSTKRSDSRYLILRTREADGTGRWYAERRNMLEDFTRVFGHAPDRDAVIGMQIDSDSTASSAEVFYRNIYRRKR